MYKGRTLCICTQQLAAVLSVQNHIMCIADTTLGNQAAPRVHASRHYSRTVQLLQVAVGKQH